MLTVVANFAPWFKLANLLTFELESSQKPLWHMDEVRWELFSAHVLMRHLDAVRKNVYSSEVTSIGITT